MKATKHVGSVKKYAGNVIYAGNVGYIGRYAGHVGRSKAGFLIPLSRKGRGVWQYDKQPFSTFPPLFFLLLEINFYCTN